MFAAVKQIKKDHLREIKALKTPPKPVEMAVSSLVLLLGKKFTEWKDIKAFMASDSFIKSIIEFDSESISYVSRMPPCSGYID